MPGVRRMSTADAVRTIVLGVGLFNLLLYQQELLQAAGPGVARVDLLWAEQHPAEPPSAEALFHDFCGAQRRVRTSDHDRLVASSQDHHRWTSHGPRRATEELKQEAEQTRQQLKQEARETRDELAVAAEAQGQRIGGAGSQIGGGA